MGVNSGVCFALSIHARDENELKTKPVFRRILATGAFSRVIFLSTSEVGKTVKTIETGDLFA